jgi:hypothetical protein
MMSMNEEGLTGYQLGIFVLMDGWIDRFAGRA